MAKAQPKSEESKPISTVDSSQKYANITESDDSYKREYSVASASNVGVNHEQSRVNSAATSRPNTSGSTFTKTGVANEMMRKNFENF